MVRPKATDAPMKPVAIKLTLEQIDRLRRRGKVEERSIAYYVRTALDKVYPAQESTDPEEAA